MSTTDVVLDVERFQAAAGTAEPGAETRPLTFPARTYPVKMPSAFVDWTTLLSSLAVDVSWGEARSAEESSVQLERLDLFRSAGEYDLRLAGRAKLARYKEIHFSREGREERIARAFESLNMPGPTFGLDYETWKWVAQEIDIEDF